MGLIQEGCSGQLRRLGADQTDRLIHPGRRRLEGPGPELSLGQLGQGGQRQPNRKVEPAEEILAHRCRLLVVAHRPQGLGQIQEGLRGGFVPAQLYERPQVAHSGSGGTLAESVTACHPENPAGVRVDQAGRHCVLSDLSGRRLTGQEHAERRFVQVSVLRGHLVVDRQAYQVMTERGPAIPRVHEQARSDQGCESVGGVGGPEPGHFRGDLGTKAPTENAGGLQIGLPRRPHADETG